MEMMTGRTLFRNYKEYDQKEVENCVYPASAREHINDISKERVACGRNIRRTGLSREELNNRCGEREDGDREDDGKHARHSNL